MKSPVRRPRLRVPATLDLAGWADRVAVRTADTSITYLDLVRRADDVGARLGDTRRLVLVEGANTIETLTAYLAALTHGHVTLLVPPGEPAARLTATWNPDVVIGEGGLTELREGTAHDTHPDLALLLSTSGSTGSPKLVRLSHTNLLSNAASIVQYLELTPADRAITSLPMHYCYGLSVVNSHLLAGAGLVLTDQSVVDDCFWQLATDAGATSFAGVPYTFDLLESSGIDPRRLPSLRYITQAGGRLAPERVRDWASRGCAAGWDLVVMYGQTEATARMAWLPPHLADQHAGSIGIPIPGGAFRIDPVPDATGDGIGELVYTGPNVMMGYAERPTDLARGAELSELHTGDLAREVDGLFELVGRRGRHAKLFGLRLDLDDLETVVADDRSLHVGGIRTEVRCVVVDGMLHAFVTRPRVADRLAAALCRSSGLPSSAIQVTTLDRFPVTSSGKPDLAAIAAHARLLTLNEDHDLHANDATPEMVRRDYALVLGRTDVSTRDSFVGLGGDSLSYVELAARLSRRLGDIPRDWQLRTVDELVATTTRRHRVGAQLEISVLLRALAIIAIVGSHANLFTVMGGAHVLLAVAGYNFARFQLAGETRHLRLRLGLASLAQVMLPASLWIGGVALVTGFYHPVTALFLNGLLGSDTWTVQWQFWFLEALVWVTAAGLALTAVPAFDRLERRAPYAVAVGLVVSALAVRFAWVGIEAGITERYTIGVVAWWFALGWAACRADTTARRCAVTGLAALGTVGFFGDPVREALVLAGIALLVHVPMCRVPQLLVTPVSMLAAASLFVYLTHWQIYPHLEDSFPLGATIASLSLGLGTWFCCRPLLRWFRRRVPS